jgi:hypothetical protein
MKKGSDVLMKGIIFSLLFVVLTSSLVAASWFDQIPLPDQLLSDKGEIHQAVLALEKEPLHRNAALVRAMLLAHYKPMDYSICGQVLGPLTDHKELAPVMWQIVIGAGDWVEQHPNRARDIDAYTLAGLESGVGPTRTCAR